MTVMKSIPGVFGLASFVAVLLCSGCRTEQIIVHGKSGILSEDAHIRLGRLAVDDATEEDVVSLLGEPSGILFADDGTRSLTYSCVVTNMKTYYPFIRSFTNATSQNTGIHMCRVYVGKDGRVRDVDYQYGTSNKSMQPTLLPRPQ